MTLYQKSSWFCAAAIALFFILVAFNYGRLTASRVYIEDCRMPYSVPFKGTLP